MQTLSNILSHLSHAEQQEATYLLALVGLRFYTVHTGSDKVNIAKLRSLCGGFSKRNKKAPTSHVEDLRLSRLDAMIHFPFADETGTIGDILKQEPAVQASPLLTMGKPGRKRFISKVFNEMRLDQTGIRLYNLPEALERLGIRISDGLRSYLLETRSVYNKDGSLRNYDEELHSFTKEVLVTLPQFEKIVCHCLLLLEDDDGSSEMHWLRNILIGGRVDAEETDKSESPTERGAGGRRDAAGLDEEWGEEEDDDLLHDRRKRRQTSIRDRGANQNNEEDDEDSLAEESSDRRRESSYKQNTVGKGKSHRQTGSRGIGSSSVTDLTYLARMKQIPSKIGGLVRADREAHQRSKSHTEKAALAALAKRRVDLITSMKGPSPYPSSAVHNIAHLQRSVSYPVGPSDGYKRDKQEQLREEQRRRRRDRERLHDTDTGRAASEIADSFLNGAIGREVSKGLIPRTVVELQADENFEYNQYLHRTVMQKSESDKEEKESRSVYAPSAGWKASRGGGGWVADFGPAHTHNQYTGVASRGEHFSSDSMTSKPWQGKRTHGIKTESHQDLKEVLQSISGSSKRSGASEALVSIEGMGDDSGFGVDDSFLVAMSKEIEEMKREEEQSYRRDRDAIVGHNELNYEKTTSASKTAVANRVVKLPQYRRMEDDNDDVDSAVVGAGEGGNSMYGERTVDYKATYGSNFALQNDVDGTPRSKNLLNILQNTVSLKEVAKK